METKSLIDCLTRKSCDFKLPRIDCELGELYHKDNGSNVLGVAHLDTVLDSTPFIHNGIVHCPQLDDRLGVWVLLHLLPSMGVNLDVLLTDNEEIGDSTGQWFIPKKQYNWIIEFDRAGTDIVFYQYKGFAKHWSGIKHGMGSYSDISFMDHIGVMAANIGIGYHGQHSDYCYADLRDTYRQVRLFSKFFAKHQNTHFPYAEKKRKKTTKRHNKKDRYEGYGSGAYKNDFTYGEARFFAHKAASWRVNGVDRCEICGISSWDMSLVETYENGQQIMCEDCLEDYRKHEDRWNSQLDSMYYKAKKIRERF